MPQAAPQLGPRLDLGQRPGLTMTPRLAQSIRMLAMGGRELDAFVAGEVERNPFLTRVGRSGNGEAEAIGERTAEIVSLTAHLEAQIGLAFRDPADRALARRLVGELDEAGYLRAGVEVAAGWNVPRERVETVLARCRFFEPAGLFARDLADCLALQLAARDRLDPAMRLVLGRLDLVARRDLESLGALTGLDDEDVRGILSDIRACDPKPGTGFGDPAPPPVLPSARVAPDGEGGWRAELIESSLPRVLVDRDYAARLSRSGARDAELREWMAGALSEAGWLARSLAQRARSILRVADEIARRQADFMRRGEIAMRPLTLREVGDALDLHESTVSRVVAGKSMVTPVGTVAMRSFFGGGVEASGGALAARAVQARIRELVAAERPGAVLSDDALTRLLDAEGVAIARRTVAKYRERCGIAPSSVRRREKGGARPNVTAVS